MLCSTFSNKAVKNALNHIDIIQPPIVKSAINIAVSFKCSHPIRIIRSHQIC